MNAHVRKPAEAAAKAVAGPKALQALKAVKKLASLQGGASTSQNYLLLGKRAAAGVAIAATAVNAGVFAAGAKLRSHLDNKRAVEITAETINRERLRQQSLEAPERSTFYERYGKRACDLAIGLVALPIVGVVTTAAGAAIKCEDGGPVFYNAPRVGRYGREFTMYKLRSMKVDAPDLVMEDGSTYNGADDPRMTRVGALLRRTSLDELPQFLNVLKGDMSVVGPRPDLKRETELYQGEEALKLTVKPGVTGYAAVYGRNSLPWHDRLALDVYYVRHLSFPLDAKVFLKTFAAVFAQEGIYVKDEAETAR